MSICSLDGCSRPHFAKGFCNKDRCYNPHSGAYKNYGGRGIKVCDRWTAPVVGFENFYSDMGPRPAGCSIDRVDNNKGYSPGNCRWAKRKEQNNNRRSCVMVDIGGEEKTLAQWSEEYGLNYWTVHARYRRGWRG